jgi:hypothetical protein
MFYASESVIVVDRISISLLVYDASKERRYTNQSYYYLETSVRLCGLVNGNL